MIQDGQIVLVRISQTDLAPGKLRPALVLRRLPGRHDDWLICLISSNLTQELSGFDEVVHKEDGDFKGSGLKQSSLIRISRLAIAEQGLLRGSLGSVSEERLVRIKQRLSRWILETPV